MEKLPTIDQDLQIRKSNADIDEVFPITLSSMHAKPALLAYARSIRAEDSEVADYVEGLAARSGKNHPDNQPD